MEDVNEKHRDDESQDYQEHDHVIGIAVADEFFVNECEKEEVVDIHLYYCLPYGEDTELTCFTRHEKMKGIKNTY